MTPIVENCRHKFIFDPETSEIVCEKSCGWAVSIFEEKSQSYASRGRKLSSPSVKDSNLGSDQNEVIRDLRRGVWDEESKKTIHLLSGALKFFPRKAWGDDEDLVEELSNRLHGRVSDSNLAAIATIFRRELRKLEKERRAKALKTLDQMTGGEPSR